MTMSVGNCHTISMNNGVSKKGKPIKNMKKKEKKDLMKRYNTFLFSSVM